MQAIDGIKSGPYILLVLLAVLAFSSKGFARGNVPPLLKTPSPPVFHIPLSTAVGTRIYQFSTVDPDSHILEYSLSAVDPATLDYFSLNSTSGTFTLRKQLGTEAFKKHPNITLFVSVNDGEFTTRSEIRLFIRPDNEDTSQINQMHFLPNFNSPFSPGSFNQVPLPPFGPKRKSTSNKPDLPSSIEEKTTPTPPIQTQWSFAPPVTTSTDKAPSTAATFSSDSVPSQSRVVDGEWEHNEKEEGQKLEAHKKSVVSYDLRYLGLLAFILPAAFILCLVRRNGRRKNENVKEKMAVVKSVSGDTDRNSCKTEDTLTIASEAKGTLHKKISLAPSLSNHRYLYRRKSASSAVLQNGSDGYLHPNVPDILWEFPRQNIRTLGLIGEGCFGQVFKAEAEEPSGEISVVAVKTLKYNATERDRQDLLNELQLMKALEPHPNVVQLLGCCTVDDPVFLIMEYVALGKLESILRRSRNSHYYGDVQGDTGATLTAHDLTSFGFQVARGMEHLSKKGILHRDLAARNILVDQDLICKVSDFGLARDIIDSHIYERKSECKLPIRWMAPESLFDNVFTVKSDVWSFGILLWEIATLGSTPYPGMDKDQIMKEIKKGYRLQKPNHCDRELYNEMYYCWHANPLERPTFVDLVDKLGNLLAADQDYLDLNKFPENSYENAYPIKTDLPDEKV